MAFPLDVMDSNTVVRVINGIGKFRHNTWSEVLMLSDSLDRDVRFDWDWSVINDSVFSWIASVGCIENFCVVCACFKGYFCSCRYGSCLRCSVDGLDHACICDNILVTARDDLII